MRRHSPAPAAAGPGLLLLGPAAVAEHLGPIADEAGALLDGLAARGETGVAGELGEPFATLVLGTVLRLPPRFAALARSTSTRWPARPRPGPRP